MSSLLWFKTETGPHKDSNENDELVLCGGSSCRFDWLIGVKHTNSDGSPSSVLELMREELVI